MYLNSLALKQMAEKSLRKENGLNLDLLITFNREFQINISPLTPQKEIDKANEVLSAKKTLQEHILGLCFTDYCGLEVHKIRNMYDFDIEINDRVSSNATTLEVPKKTKMIQLVKQVYTETQEPLKIKINR